MKTKKQAAAAIDKLGKSAVADIRKAMHEANKMVNSGYPFAYEHMKRSIDGKGAIVHASNSKISKAILNSVELKKLVKKHKTSICLRKTSIFFTSNRDLARTLYRATLAGDLEIEDKTFKFTGLITDEYDFRFDLIPVKKTLKGFALRYAGNAAYMAQEMKLMKSYKITVKVDGQAKK